MPCWHCEPSLAEQAFPCFKESSLALLKIVAYKTLSHISLSFFLLVSRNQTFLSHLGIFIILLSPVIDSATQFTAQQLCPSVS